jgi:hypothetical protein
MALQAGALGKAGHVCGIGSAVIASANGAIGILPDSSIMREIDVLVLQPMVGTDLADVLKSAKRAGQSIVVDLDDWFWDTPEFPLIDGALQRSDFDEWRDQMHRLVGESQLVTASTPFIAQEILSWNNAPPTRLVRNAIDLRRWPGPENVTDGPVLGYAGSLYNHLEDVQLLRGWLGPFLERHDLRLIHVGGHPSLPDFSDLIGVDPARVEVRDGRAWAAYATSRPFAGMDIGLVPLLARPFNQAKSALKGMEYAACGVPFVASSSPEYEWLGTGTLVGSSFDDQGPDAWIHSVEKLLDPSTRAVQAHLQTDRVAREDIGLRWTDWERIYLELVAGRR